MFTRRQNAWILAISLLLVSCASAGKRYDQGRELEMQGRYDGAVTRYVQALEKDPTMTEARARLLEAGDAAVSQRLEDAEAWNARQDPVSAADQYQQIDGLVAQSRGVGVRLWVPENYEDRRRVAFDAAISTLLERGHAAGERGNWPEGIDAYRQARTDFEPSSSQRDEALAGESGLLLHWSRQELHAGHYRDAFEAASAVHELEWSPPEDSELAAEFMEQALLEGEVELMVLPLIASSQPRSRLRNEAMMDMEVRVNERLDQAHWRQPPPFVAVSDPVAIRALVREFESLKGGLQAGTLGLLLRLSDADYGAWMELLSLESTEFDVSQTTRAVKTRDGRSTTFVLEKGQRRLQAEARLIVVDRNGNELVSQMIPGMAAGPFQRGVYDGDPAELSLGRRDLDAFDRLAQESQEQAIRQGLAIDLSDRLAAGVLNPVLSRVP